MILGRVLTPAERKSSQRNYNLFSMINGASYMCLGENVIVLLAVHLGAPNAFVAILGSMVFLGYLVMPLGVFRTAKVGAAACQADFWVCRNLSALLIALSPLVALYSPTLALCVMLTGSFVFYGCRAAGCVLGTPLASDIATKEEVPILMSVNAGYFHLSGVFMIVVIASLLFFFESIWMLVGVIVFGAALGITASNFIRKVDETGAVRDAARQNLIHGIAAAFKIRDVRMLAPAWFGVNISIIAYNSISTLGLKRGCGFSDTAALVCAAAMFAASAYSARLAGKLCKHLGPKFVLKSACLLYLAVPVLWLIMPERMPGATSGPSGATWCCAIVLFSILGVINICVTNAAAAYFLMICPDKKILVPGSISIQLVTGVGAGLAGSAFSSWLILKAEVLSKALQDYFPGDIGVFRVYFLLLIPVTLLVFLYICKLRVVILEFTAKYGKKAIEHMVLHKIILHR